MNDLGSKVADNMLFVAEFAGLVFVIFLIAYLVEKRIHLKNHDTERILSTRKIALVGLFAAVSAVLMVLEVPVPFAPPFYKIDLSELPILIITFAFGPVAGVMTEFIKILAFVGELANFSVGCTLILPAGIIYLSRKTKKMALIACVTGTLCMTLFGSAFNAVYLLPKFAQLFGMPLEAIVGMGTKINPSITSVETMALFAVAPLNLLKGSIDTVLTMLLYKRLSPILKSSGRR